MTEVPSRPDPIDRVVVAHRFVQAGILLTLIWKWSFFVWATRVYAHLELQDAFFPDWLRSVWTVLFAFLAAVGSSVLNLITASRQMQRVCSWITFAGVSVLCVHQASYNDMTFVTAWWASLWALWYIQRMDDDDQSGLLRRGALLSRLIISVILLGGAAGKWTAEYWSGEVFYDIYFLDRNFWLFNLLRANFDPEALREISMWYSRKVIILETVAGLGIWLLPPRWAAIAAIVLLSSIALFSNFLLFSVLFSLIGLAAVGLLVERQPFKSSE